MIGAPGERPPQQATTHQMWANLLALGVVVVALAAGWVLRLNAREATEYYQDPTAGIEIERPVGWLLDSQGDYVFRLRSPAALPFKTTLQVSVLTIGPDATGRNVLDALTLRRSANLSGYRVLSVSDPVDVPNSPVVEMRYAYVASETNPFLEALPIVVMGVDMVFLKGDQAVIASYLADPARFDAEYFRFEQFLASLRF
jgi:hypothetical protein